MIGFAIRFYDVVLFLHISSVIIGFGATFAYPLIFAVAARSDPRSMPTILRISDAIGTRLINPFLVAIIATGIYLVADGDYDVGDLWLSGVFAIVIVIGALGGAFFAPNGRKIITVADRDVAAAGDGEVTWSEEFMRLQQRLSKVGLLANLLVLAAVFLMTTKPGL
jgi:uncharacterized membrane protein